MATARKKKRSATDGEPRKVRWTVRAEDVSIKEWIDTQANLSQSLRELVREAIERDGFIDVVYRPIEQLPRRGRPPAQSSAQDADTVAAPASTPVQDSEPAAPAKQRSSMDEVVQDEPTAKPAPAPKSAPEPVESSDDELDDDGQVDMNAIMSSLRR